MKTVFLSAAWRKLLMANYEVEANLLLPYLPAHTELDTFNGRLYLSLVGFLFDDVKLRGIGIPGYRAFEEVNLRFYVRHQTPEGWKRGVVFISELVPSKLIAQVANTFYGEHYKGLPMMHRWVENGDQQQVHYAWKSGADWQYMEAEAAREAQAIVPGSEEQFITEHFWGYTKIDEKRSAEYGVEHPSWNIHRVSQFTLSLPGKGIYPDAFSEVLRQKPASVFLADGSPIRVLNKKIIR